MNLILHGIACSADDKGPPGRSDRITMYYVRWPIKRFVVIETALFRHVCLHSRCATAAALWSVSSKSAARKSSEKEQMPMMTVRLGLLTATHTQPRRSLAERPAGCRARRPEDRSRQNAVQPVRRTDMDAKPGCGSGEMLHNQGPPEDDVAMRGKHRSPHNAIATLHEMVSRAHECWTAALKRLLSHS